MQVPPGEYVLSMGFDSNLATSKAEHPYVDVYFNDVLIGTKLAVEASSPWNFDRVNNCTATYLGHTVSKWDGDGGAVGTVTIPGTQLTSFTIKVAFNSFYSTYTTKKELHVYHWALRPTSNNY